jgi:hypothetical protein
MRSKQSALCASIVSMAALLGLPAAARAQAPSSGSNKVAAEALFEDGRKLVGLGNYAEACPKFADSERLDPSSSTLLNLASCWEKLGRSATAWATYKEAESSASAARRQDYVAVAQRHAEALAPKLSRLTIDVSRPIENLQVKRDSVLVGSAEWGSAIPLDTGAHTVEASAPGYKDWRAAVDVTRDGADVVIAVPPLEALPAEALAPAAANALPAPAPPPPAPPAETTSNRSAQRTIGLVVASAGVAGLALSGVFAVIANSKNTDSLNDCDKINKNSCNSMGVSTRNDALFAGDVATVSVGTGAGLLVVGAALWFSAPRRGLAGSDHAARVVVIPTLGGAILKGTWQ